MRRYLWHLLTDRRGIALVTVLALMGVLSLLAASYTLSIRADTALRGGTARERTGFYAAEAGLNNAMAEVKEYFEAYSAPGSYQRTITVGTGSHERDTTYSVAPVAGRTPGPPMLIPMGRPFAGLYAIPSDYVVTSTAKNQIGDQEATVGAQFTVNSVPVFQFLAFFKDALEIAPGPSMTLSGRIHTNSDLYLNGQHPYTVVRIGDRRSPPNAPPDNPFIQISAAGDIYRGPHSAQPCSGTVWIDKQEDSVTPTPDFDPLALPCTGGATKMVSKVTLANYLGSMRARENPLLIPNVDVFERGGSGGAGGVFWQKADLRLVLNLQAERVQNFCGDPTPNAGGGNGLFAIEVQEADGSRNVSKTDALWQFMCERRGAIFYTDLPKNPPTSWPLTTIDPSNSGSNRDPSNPHNYAPHFGSAASVYRRVGEDTNGDGTVDSNGDAVVASNDLNFDVCPVWVGPAGTIGPRPAWRPDFCNQKFGSWSGAGNNNIFAQRNDVKNLLSTSWFADNDYRRGGFYSRRENKWVMMLNVNIRALIDWNETNGTPLFDPADATDGGLVFFLSVQADDSTTTPPPTARRYGVRVFDSANLNTQGGTFPRPLSADPTGLSLASDQSIYVLGNYNYYPAMTLATKIPAAIMGDSVNVLSLGWEVPVIRTPNGEPERQYNNDRKSGGTLSVSRLVPPSDRYYNYVGGIGTLQCAVATCTSLTTGNPMGINAAFISGMDTPVAGQSNGGLHNFPRFHEDWSFRPDGQAALNYRGSFVSLGAPVYATGPWGGAGENPYNIYNAPIRNWDYDASFNDNRLLPPLTPMVNLLQQQMFTRFYQ
jgi:hypothetical protein